MQSSLVTSLKQIPCRQLQGVHDEPPRKPLKLELHKPLTADVHTQEKLTESTGLELKSSRALRSTDAVETFDMIVSDVGYDGVSLVSNKISTHDLILIVLHFF